MKMRLKILSQLCPLLLMVGIMMPQAGFAKNSPVDGEWQGTPHVGFSPYTGLVGLELQNTNFGLTLGWPASIGLKYYFDEKGDRLFLGTHALHLERDNDETKDGVLYTENERTLLGAGVGYKWQSEQGWNLTLSLSIVYDREKLKNGSGATTEEDVISLPGLTFGYRF